MMLKAPFHEPSKEIMRIEHRFHTFMWGETPDLTLLNQYDANKTWYRTSLINIDKPHEAEKVLWDLSMEDEYKYPGDIVFRQLQNGFWVIRKDGTSIFLSGCGASPNGDRPFLDKFDIKSLQTSRLFHSTESAYERFCAFGSNNRSFLTCRESPEHPPNIFRILKTTTRPLDPGTISESVAITRYTDPTLEVREIRKRFVHYERLGTLMDDDAFAYTVLDSAIEMGPLEDSTPFEQVFSAYSAGDLDGIKSIFDGMEQKLIPYMLRMLAMQSLLERRSVPLKFCLDRKDFVFENKFMAKADWVREEDDPKTYKVLQESKYSEIKRQWLRENAAKFDAGGEFPVD
ncbi:hypothetical protein BX600DRAFT_555689 [Xylariales sp. PMI_506]|nr:hypothetical protein BX600DRAFT_555689 [Xylariales sp. PMI_506]